MNKTKRQYMIWLIALFLLFFTSWQLISNFYDQQVLTQHEDFLQQKNSSFIRLTKEENADFAQVATDYVKDTNERITRLNRKGEVLYDTFDPNLSGRRSQRPEVKAVLEGNDVGNSVRMSPTLDQELLYVAIPIKKDGEITEIIRMAEPTKSFLPEANRMKLAIFLVNFIFWLILTLIILAILKRRNRPVETILPVIKQMIKEPKQQKMVMRDSSEWEELYQNINILSQQMSETYTAFNTSEKQFYTLLNELMVGVFIIDEQGNLAFVNETLTKQLNIKDRADKQPFTLVLTEPQLIQMIYQTRQTNVVKRQIRTTATDLLLDLTIRTFKDSGHTFGISYDITHISQLEKLQNDFIGNISHELKTPITSLIGFTETLLDGAKEDPQTLESFLEIMQKDAYRLQSLVQEIIETSKSASLDYIITSVNVSKLIDEIMHSYDTTIEEKELDVQLKGPQNLVLNTKAELFQPICKNLIENAIHYASNSGKIIITFYVKEKEFVFSVQDDGIGIHHKEQERIFERFYRVDKARSRNSGGNGLGLAIVKDYSRMLGGNVTLDSYPGIGSTFTVTLPIL